MIYKILSSESKLELSRQVEDEMRNELTPCGGVAIEHTPETDVRFSKTIFHQAMVNLQEVENDSN